MGKAVSNRVDNAIKECWAKLATKQFAVAVDSIGKLSDTACGEEAEERMLKVDRWLKKAGAEATRWHFRAKQP